jgi:hypothetical protein
VDSSRQRRDGLTKSVSAASWVNNLFLYALNQIKEQRRKAQTASNINKRCLGVHRRSFSHFTQVLCKWYSALRGAAMAPSTGRHPRSEESSSHSLFCGFGSQRGEG